MARCECCNRIKVGLMIHGGSSICSRCMNIHNPKTSIFKRLSAAEIKAKTSKISELENDILKIKEQIERNERLFKCTTENKITAITGYWDY